MRKRELREMNEKFRDNLSKESQGTVGKLDPFLLTEMLKASGHADTRYVEDLLCGFPIVGDLPSGGNGTPIPGGQRVHGRPGFGGSPPLQELKGKCLQINEATIRRACRKVPKTSRDLELARKTWEKVRKDIDENRAGNPIELESVALGECLLVDTFGVWERHAGSDWKVRVINNFKSNTANDYAWMPSKLRYNGFSDLKEAAEKLKENWDGALEMGKSDFRSAFKTLPPSHEQQWLCWALVYNPELERHQVVPLYCQAFGSLGGVVAWFRTVAMIQSIMQDLFGLVVFAYVDDCFWVAPKFATTDGHPTAAWVAQMFESVVTELLGWRLDPDKAGVGACIVLLGLEVEMAKDWSSWRLADTNG